MERNCLQTYNNALLYSTKKYSKWGNICTWIILAPITRKNWPFFWPANDGQSCKSVGLWRISPLKVMTYSHLITWWRGIDQDDEWREEKRPLDTTQMLLLTEHTLYSKSVEKILEFSQEYDLLALNSDGTILRNGCELVFCPCFKEISFCWWHGCISTWLSLTPTYLRGK